MVESRFVPAGASKVASKNSPAVVYLGVRAGRFIAVGYFGKAVKPSFFHGWKDEARRNAWVADWLRGCDARAASKSASKAIAAAQRAAGHKLSVGSVLRCSWGYDQTNVDHFEVVALKGKRQVVVRKIACESIETGFMQGKCVPLKGSYLGEEMVKTVSVAGDSVRIFSFASAYLVEPVKVGGVDVGFKPSHWTAYA